MKTDEQIKSEVVLALLAESIQNPGTLKVAVNDGVVTLRGSLDSSSKKFSAWRAACSVKGVRAVKLAIIVLLDSGSDDEIKRFF